MAVELILIRHGESEGNVGRSSDPDCPLTEAGLEQARQVGRQLAGYDLRGFAGLVSPYRRTRQTAEAIALATGLSFAIEEGVREWGPAATINNRHYPVEPGEQLVERLRDFLRRYEGRKLVVISHAAPIAALTQVAWGESPNTQGAFWEGVNNCCLRWLKATLNPCASQCQFNGSDLR
ncbi:MAG: histidine phosphatase family protein [Bacillota bacterium]